MLWAGKQNAQDIIRIGVQRVGWSCQQGRSAMPNRRSVQLVMFAQVCIYASPDTSGCQHLHVSVAERESEGEGCVFQSLPMPSEMGLCRSVFPISKSMTVLNSAIRPISLACYTVAKPSTTRKLQHQIWLIRIWDVVLRPTNCKATEQKKKVLQYYT